MKIGMVVSKVVDSGIRKEGALECFTGDDKSYLYTETSRIDSGFG